MNKCERLECDECPVKEQCDELPNMLFYEDYDNLIGDALIKAYEKGKKDGRGEVD